MTLFTLSSCTSTALFVANGVASLGDYDKRESIPYSEYPETQLDLYQPKPSSKGTVVFFYGGCWGACQTFRKGKYQFVADALTQAGYTVVIPDYRLFPGVGFGEIMQDATATIRWVEHNRDHYDLPRPLVVMGHSSGAHLAAMLVTNRTYLGAMDHQNVDGLIGLAGPYDFEFTEDYMDELFAGMPYETTQPAHFVDVHTPAMLLLHGEADQSVHRRNIDGMTRKMQRFERPVSSEILPGVKHAEILAALSRPLKNRYQVLPRIERFLDDLSQAPY